MRDHSNRTQVISVENRVVCDVDQTLVLTGKSISAEEFKAGIGNFVFTQEAKEKDPTKQLIAPYYEGYKLIEPVYAVESFLRSLKSRGYHITVHSHNGWQWAFSVVIALGLGDIVDLVCTKPAKCIDDATEFSHINGTLIHPGELK